MQIATLASCDRETLDRHIRAGLPFIMPGLARDWPACSKWTPRYLSDVCADNAIPVSQYPDGTTLRGKIKMTVAEYVAALQATPDSYRHYYMESVDLDELSPALYRDLRVPDFLQGLPGATDTVFFGHSTGSCCHIHAHEESFVLQLMGEKIFHLYPPEDVGNLYFESLFADYRRSQIDFEHPDPQRFPRLHALSHCEVRMQPGDGLYLPLHWAHWTAATDFTFTLTRFFDARLRDYHFPSPGLRCLAGRTLSRWAERLRRR